MVVILTFLCNNAAWDSFQHIPLCICEKLCICKFLEGKLQGQKSLNFFKILILYNIYTFEDVKHTFVKFADDTTQKGEMIR